MNPSLFFCTTVQHLLKFLVKLCSDMGLKEASDYAMELKKAERSKDLAEQRAMSSRPGSRRGSGKGSVRSGSAASAGELGVPGSASDGSRVPSRAINSMPGSAISNRSNRLTLEEEEEPYQLANTEVDPSYTDPLGPLPERPKTSVGGRGNDDDFADEEIGDDLLPE